MNNYDPKFSSLKDHSKRAVWDYHLRLSTREKQTLMMLAKNSNFPTLAAWIKDQLFRPDIHHKLNIIISQLDKLGEDKADAEERSRKTSKKKG